MTGGLSPAVGLVSWRLPATGAAALGMARRLDVAGVQLDLGGPGRGPWLDQPGELEACRRRAAETNVAVIAVAGNVLNDIGLTAPAGSGTAREARAVLIRLLDAAVALGCPMVFVPSFRRSAIGGPQDLRHTITMLRWAAAEAAGRGLLLANENVLPAAAARVLVEGVSSPAFRLLLDTYNLASAGLDPAALVGALAPYLADQVHLKDGVNGGDTRGPLGAGEGRVAATLAALAAEGVPASWLVLENDYRDGDQTRAARDVAWVRDRCAGLGWQGEERACRR